MAKVASRAKMSVSAGGTGALTLGAAATGFLTFANASPAIANGDIVSYVIEDGSNFEFGYGTYSSTGPTLTRNTVVNGSSGAGTAINVTTNGYVFLSPLATDLGLPLNTQVASNSAALTDTASFTGNFAAYKIVFDAIVPVTNNVDLRLQLQSGGSFQSANYFASYSKFDGGGNQNSSGSSSFITVAPGVMNSYNNGLTGDLIIYDVSQTSFMKNFKGDLVGPQQGASNTTTRYFPHGFWNGGNGAITGVQAYFSSGNVLSGQMRVIGLPA